MSALTSSASALAALEPYLLLAKNAKGAAAAKLIEQATSAPGCYVFSELLDVEGIKQLADSPAHASHYALLELFAYGAFPDYTAAQTAAQAPGGPKMIYPALNEAQSAKLQRLTLVTYASRSRVLDYGTLANALGLATGPGSTSAAGSSTVPNASYALSESCIRELEDIIIEALYAGVLSGKLNQQLRRFEVEAAMGRDVRGAQELGDIANSLQAWSTSADVVLNQLSERISGARASARRAAEQKSAHEAEITKVLYQLYDQALGGRKGAAAAAERRKADEGDAMDVDAEVYERGDRETGASHGGRRKKMPVSQLARHKRSRN
ncbi:hypothetical protein OC846_000353 [Tilletia horrida]|uniref:PCI domain-containing protein n=1 Tax=Tilletia horrida TaxID=155126 RepID=A0AAN6GW06_9BASI|nr:hypothetical protein OC846_000353 [Tilletia horrida]